MCLIALHETLKYNKLTKQGYQLRNHDGCNSFTTRSLHKNFEMVTGKYYTSESYNIYAESDEYMHQYKPGFHVFTTLKAAKIYRNHNCLDTPPIYKVTGRGILALGRQNVASRPKRAASDCFICRKLRVDEMVNELKK